MGSAAVLLVFLNCLFVSGLLWVITFFGSFLYETKHDLNREVHFECGFFSVNKNIPSYSINFVVSAVFLILYDIELLLLIPALFNLHLMCLESLIFILLFMITIFYSLLLDVESNTIKWYFN